MKSGKYILMITLITGILTALVSSCQKKKMVISQNIYNGEYIRQRALNCNIHDSIYLDTPDGILFMPYFTNNIFGSAYSYDEDYELMVTADDFGFSNKILNVEYRSAGPSAPDKVVIQIIKKATNEVYMGYSGKAVYISVGSGSGYVNFCNVLFRDGSGNGSYFGTGYIYTN
jgi:hypothetical protein